MNRSVVERGASLIAGVLFGVGLVVGGMTLPSKVTGFLDFAGSWDPTLMFVMGGAVMVHVVAYQFVRHGKRPLASDRFRLPTRRDIDGRLVAGAALFGIGWGLGGYCPGPALTSLVSGQYQVVAFVVAMLGSMWLVGQVEAALRSRGAAHSS